MKKVTFQEIITRMENAEEYSELYDAASLIENESLRVDVEQLIGQCEDDGDDVSTVYSVVASDLLDSCVNEENIKEESKKVTEEIDRAYLENQVKALSNIEATTFEELQSELDRLLEEESINDDEYDIFTDIVSDREDKCIAYIEKRGKVTNTDYEDELAIEEDNVKSTIEELIDSVNAVLNEGRKVTMTEGKELNANSIAEFLKDSVKQLQETEYTCFQYKLDDDLSVFVGWSGGYGNDKDDSIIQDPEDMSFAINAGVKCNHEYMKTDYDYLDFPFDPESGEVWDAGVSISPNEDYTKTAEWLIEEYQEILKALRNGELVLESKKVEESSNTGVSLYDWLEERDFEPSIDIVDNDCDMMVAFEFDIENADKEPFDSYMAMLAKQLKVLDDGNDILTVNMTDYVKRNFDLLDAIFDTSANSEEDEICQLVSDTMPSVLSGYATDSVYTELLNNSKVVESKKLTEGAGAGYTVSGELSYEPQIKSFNVVSRENDIMEVDCDVDGILEDVTFESYNYGDRVDEADVHISHVTLDVCNLKDDDNNDIELDEQTFKDALDGLKVSPLIGAGWVHTTFDGNLSCDENNVDCNAYSDIYVMGVKMNLTNSDLVNYIDEAVRGANIFEQYTVFDEEEDAMETFDTEEEAIEYAKNNNGYKVESSQFRYNFDDEVEDLFVEEVVWVADDLNESKKIVEKTSLDDYKDYCNDLSIDYKKSSSLNKYLNDFTNNEAKMNGISDITDKVNQLRNELKQGLKESRKLEVKKMEESQIKDESLFSEVMSFLYGEYIKDNYDLGDDEDIINDILRYTYLASLVDLPENEEDMETEDIVKVPAVQELLKRIREEDNRLRDVDTYEGKLELSNRGLLSEISNEEMYNKLGDEEFMNWYWEEADSALEEFASSHELDPNEITYSGRGARHILIPATYQNALRYQELKADFQQFQDEFVQRINSYEMSED